MCNWEARRVAFNHDWLKTKYMSSIEALMTDIEYDCVKPDDFDTFCREEFPQWDTQRLSVNALLDTFETDMSPQRVFDEAPLNACPEELKAAWGEVVHVLWQHRYGIPARLDAGRKAVRALDEEYTRLEQQLEQQETGSEFCKLLSFLRDYAGACTRLGEAMGDFSAEIRVI